MFHPDAQSLIDTWSALEPRGGLPLRTAFDPASLGRLLPQTFMANRTGDGARFRLAGDWVERLHGRPLRDQSWLDLWSDDSRPLVSLSIAQTFREARPVVLVADAEGTDASIEIVMTPLRGPNGEFDRLLGLYAPTTAAARDLKDAGLLMARLSLGVGDIRRAALHLATIDGRQVA